MNDDFDPLRSVLTGLIWGGASIAVLLLVLLAPWWATVAVAVAIAGVLHASNTAAQPR